MTLSFLAECTLTVKEAIFPACAAEESEKDRWPKRTDDTITYYRMVIYYFADQ